MQYLQQSLFVLLSAAAIWLLPKKPVRSGEIFLGKDENLSNNPSQRFKNLLLLARTEKMFKNPLVALMHLVVYAGFIIINLEVLEIVLDGILGSHRLFLPFLENFYTGSSTVLNF